VNGLPEFFKQAFEEFTTSLDNGLFLLKQIGQPVVVHRAVLECTDKYSYYITFYSEGPKLYVMFRLNDHFMGPTLFFNIRISDLEEGKIRKQFADSGIVKDYFNWFGAILESGFN
jgi:hypothetical protein